MGPDANTMNDSDPWTLNEFRQALRDAGWRATPSPAGGYQHTQTGRIFEMYEWTQERKNKTGHGEAWREWAAVRQTPPPF